MTVCSYTTATDTVILVHASLVGRNTANGAAATAKQTHRFKNVGGALSAVASAVDLVTFTLGSDAALATSVITIDASGTSIRLRVAGIIATNIDWFGELKVYIT